MVDLELHRGFELGLKVGKEDMENVCTLNSK